MVGVYSLCESSVAVFLREQAGVVVGDLDRLVFEEGVAQGEEILDLWGLSANWIGLGARNVEKLRLILFLRACLWST